MSDFASKLITLSCCADLGSRPWASSVCLISESEGNEKAILDLLAPRKKLLSACVPLKRVLQ